MLLRAARLSRYFVLCAGLALAGIAIAAPPPAPSKVHGNTKFQPGSALIRYGEARAAVMDALNKRIVASGTKLRKVRVEDVAINKDGTWNAVVRQKRTGAIQQAVSGQVQLGAPGNERIAAAAFQIYQGRRTASASTDWEAAKQRLESTGRKPSEDQIRRLAHKISQERTPEGDWRKAERALRRSSDRVTIQQGQQP